MNAKPFDAERKDAKIAGVFFIAATTTAVAGGLLYEPLQQTNYLLGAAQHSMQIISGAVFELLLAVSATGTAIMLYPQLKKYHESWGLGYVCFRLLEVVFIMIGIVSILGILTLSRYYTGSSKPDQALFESVGRLLKGIHLYTVILGPKFMLGINTFIYSLIFFRSRLVPQGLAIMGIAGAILVFTAGIFNLFEVVLPFSPADVVFILPIALYEMILAGWLIVKGFYEESDQPARSMTRNAKAPGYIES